MVVKAEIDKLKSLGLSNVVMFTWIIGNTYQTKSGLTKNELCELLGLKWWSILMHVKQLQEKGIVETQIALKNNKPYFLYFFNLN